MFELINIYSQRLINNSWYVTCKDHAYLSFSVYKTVHHQSKQNIQLIFISKAQFLFTLFTLCSLWEWWNKIEHTSLRWSYWNSCSFFSLAFWVFSITNWYWLTIFFLVRTLLNVNVLLRELVPLAALRHFAQFLPWCLHLILNTVGRWKKGEKNYVFDFFKILECSFLVKTVCNELFTYRATVSFRNREGGLSICSFNCNL